MVPHFAELLDKKQPGIRIQGDKLILEIYMQCGYTMKGD